ncbi:MAG: hypothetical protein RJA22_2445 [Verrucomicrobiota bacterium]|jgi:SAM-dependent methyltransferase
MPGQTSELPLQFSSTAPAAARPADLADDLAGFEQFGTATRRTVTRAADASGAVHAVPTFVNEFWTARQRQANRLHEVSYRACFKPQLPRFFIERLTRPGEVVYDPFMGRGTTPIEAALLGRVPAGCDINPLSAVLTRPRIHPPGLDAIAARLQELPLDRPGEEPEELLAFFHPEVLQAISSLRRYFLERTAAGLIDGVDDWLRMVALNRLTGHSAGFFSVYTLPPNQAVSVASQRRINEKRGQTPPRRDVRAILLKKSRLLLSDLDEPARRALRAVAPAARFLTGPSHETPGIPDGSVSLVVTSPPFLDVVQYDVDNWLRCWFLGLDARSVRITMARRLEEWQESMTAVLREVARVLRPGGHVAFEVGEVRGGTVRLEESVIPCGVAAGLTPRLVLINDQEFTKTANCWGVDNMGKGTNTNRIVVLRRDA